MITLPVLREYRHSKNTHYHSSATCHSSFPWCWSLVVIDTITLGMQMKVQTGFTLTELLVAVAVFAITVSFAVPNFREFIANNRLVSTTNDFVSSLLVGRSEAAKRKVTVTVCGSSDGASCNTSSWENGWIVFTDIDGDGTLDSGTDEMLQVNSAVGNSLTIRTVGFAQAGRVQYGPKGTIDSTGSFKLCDSRGASYARAININITGRTRLATDDDSDGIVNDYSGGNLTCP